MQCGLDAEWGAQADPARCARLTACTAASAGPAPPEAQLNSSPRLLPETSRQSFGQPLAWQFQQTCQL